MGSSSTISIFICSSCIGIVFGDGEGEDRAVVVGEVLCCFQLPAEGLYQGAAKGSARLLPLLHIPSPAIVFYGEEQMFPFFREPDGEGRPLVTLESVFEGVGSDLIGDEAQW